MTLGPSALIRFRKYSGKNFRACQTASDSTGWFITELRIVMTADPRWKRKFNFVFKFVFDFFSNLSYTLYSHGLRLSPHPPPPQLSSRFFLIVRQCETSSSHPDLGPTDIENCKQLLSRMLACTRREISKVKTTIWGSLNVNTLCNYFYCKFNPFNSYINYINKLSWHFIGNYIVLACTLRETSRIKTTTVRSGNNAATNSVTSPHSCSNATPTTGSPRVSHSFLW